MATPRVTIDQLPDQAIVEDANYIIVQDSGVTKKLLMSTLRAASSPPLNAHLADTTDAHDASAISATTAGTGVDATDVQGQLAQLATLANSKINQTVADGLYVNLTGDTMTGALNLPAAAPTLPAHAANKQYVDDVVAAASEGITQAEADARYVNLTGDTMTSFLTLNADPTSALHAATKQYADRKPFCVVTMFAAQSLVSGSNTALSFDTETFDSYGWHAAGTPTLITPTIAGYYRASLQGHWASRSDFTELHVRLQRNGADLSPFVAQRWQAAARALTTPPFSVISYPVLMNGSTDSFRWLGVQANTAAAANGVLATCSVDLVYAT
jgi:hypothetical protein